MPGQRYGPDATTGSQIASGAYGFDRDDAAGRQTWHEKARACKIGGSIWIWASYGKNELLVEMKARAGQWRQLAASRQEQ